MRLVRFSLTVAFSFLLTPTTTTVLATPPSEKPSTRQLAIWVKQLGDESFLQREKASKNLWATGHAAEAVLQEALCSTDLEVVRRARDILEKFKWGIYPDTPADIVALIRAYQTTDGNARTDVIDQLLRKEAAGLQALQKITRAETNEQRKKQFRDLVSRCFPATFLNAVKDGHFERSDLLLEIGHDLKSINHREYVAYWMLRGKLDLPIARFHALLRQERDDYFSAETLFYLYRAQRNWEKAGKAVRQTRNEVLLESILFESGDLKALAALSVLKSVESPVEKKAFQAAIARLTGDQKAFERSIEELKEHKESGPEREAIAFSTAKALLLNDRPGEGLRLLAAVPDRRVLLFDLLCSRLEYRRALEMAEATEGQASGPLGNLTLAKARTLSFLGEKDQASRLFKRGFEQIDRGIDSRFALALLQEEFRAGLTDLAFEHCAALLDFSAKKIENDSKSHVKANSFLSAVFPEHAATAVICWPLLRQRHKDEPTINVLHRLRNALLGKTDSKEIKQWVEDFELEKDSNDSGVLPRRRGCLAEIALANGLETQAVRLLEKADTAEALVRLGDLHARKALWKEATQFYLRAWDKGKLLTSGSSTAVFPDPLPLFLAGAALIEDGQRRDGEKLMEQAHWVPLGDAASRLSFVRSLGERGYKEAAHREAELLWCISEPNSHFAAAAARFLALDAAKRKDYLLAAQGIELSMLRCLHGSTQFVANGAYALVPSQAHQLRALGHLEAGKLDACKQEIELSLSAAQGNLDLPIALVPELEKRGQKKEADRLYTRCHEVYARLCQRYPRCAWAHNSLAWLAVCCRRDLDEALLHARKTLELSPATAGYHDTLAEVLFQRGDKEQAIRSQKRAIELDPLRKYYRRQLERLQKGNSAAERPAEED